MNSQDIFSLLPLIITAGGIILLLIVISIRRNHWLTFAVASAVLIAAFISLFSISEIVPYRVGNLFVIDSYSLFFFGLIFFASLLVLFFSKTYFDRIKEEAEEYYVMILLTTLGAATLVSSHHFVSLFLGFEILSTSLYVLIAYIRQRDISFEAGIKYLVLAAISSAFLLFGMALIFASTGTMYFPDLASVLTSQPVTMLTVTGLGMMVVGIGYKLALVPFHLWIPDVYEGAPAPVTGLIASVSKVGVFALWLRFISEVGAFRFPSLIVVFSILAAASMLAGNLLALQQTNVKRILAYSSIAHMGYLIVAFLVGNQNAVEASSFYLVAYTVTILGAFGTVSIISGAEHDAASIDDYRGLFWRRPWVALVFTIMLLSLAGIPLTAGFLGKFYVLMTGIQANLWWLTVVLIISSTIGLFYYLRIVVSMFSQAEGELAFPKARTLSVFNVFASAVLLILLLVLGIYPSLIIELIRVFSGSL